MYLFKLQTVFVTIAKCTLCSEGGSYLMLVAAALASLVEERGGTGGAGSDMEMICHSGAEIISDIGQIRKISGGNPKNEGRNSIISGRYSNNYMKYGDDLSHYSTEIISVKFENFEAEIQKS